MKAGSSSRRLLSSMLALSAVCALHGCGGGGGGGGGASSPPSTSASQSPSPSSPVTLDAAVDQAVTPFMSTHGITALTITIMKNGSVLVDKGYGFKDAAHTISLPANALMLTGSTVKPVTAAAIQKLANDGMLALSDHVFCTGNNTPCRLPQSLLPASYDPRVKDITIAHLLAHSGGWNRSISGDQFGQEPDVQSALGLSTPPTIDDDIRYMISKPLDFAPGTEVQYSNFGYLLLGRIIAQTTGKSYVQYVQESIMGPLGIASADFNVSASLLANEDPREPNYITTFTAPSVYSPGSTALFIDGGVNMQNWVSVGTAITTSRALAAFAGTYRIAPTGMDDLQEGIPLGGTTNTGIHGGSLPGASSVVRQWSSGVSYAVLMNTENPPSVLVGMGSMMAQTIDGVLAQTGYR